MSAGLISTLLFTVCPCVIIIIVAVVVVRSNRRRNINVTTTTVGAPQTTVAASSVDSYSQVNAFPLKPPASAPPDPSMDGYSPEQPAPPYSKDPQNVQTQLNEYQT